MLCQKKFFPLPTKTLCKWGFGDAKKLHYKIITNQKRASRYREILNKTLKT